jgi:transglutaminase-like putative cysteine protease
MIQQARWEAMFAPRSEPHERATQARRPVFLAPWEDWLLLGLLTVAFLSVTAAVDRARWADDLPPLPPVGLFGLALAFGLARLRWNEVASHAAGLFAGLGVCFAQVLAVVPGATPGDRWDALYDRMDRWLHAAFQGGTSTDELPFVMLVVTLTWLGAYLSSWALFRWRHVWLALVPGGVAILVNVSYLPGQFSFAFVVYLFAALLLLAATAVRDRAVIWERDGVEYPEFLQLQALGGAFWAALVLLGATWALPLAGESRALASLWDRATEPVVDWLAPYSRVFLGVDARRPLPAHRFDDVLPFQGRIELPSIDVAQLEGVDFLPAAPYLRARAYAEYTAEGWKLPEADARAVGAGETIVSGAEQGRERREITVTVERGQSALLTLGQPVRVDRDAVAQVGPDGGDVLGLRAPDEGRVAAGTVYRVEGSVSVATVEDLRAAGDDYPRWTRAYLGLPDELPERVRALAADVTVGQTNAYDRAAAIEAYLRGIPVDYDIEPAPVGRDPVDYFLFDLRRGYFDYHASAMAVMLRTLGIPARVAVGYAVGAQDRDPGGGYRITEKRAFAWTEVFFPGYGWIEFNPTPSEPPVRRPSAAAPGDGIGPNDDLLGFGDIPAAGGGFGLFPEETPPDGAAASSDGARLPAPLLGFMGALAAMTAGALLGWWAWNRGLRGLDRASRAWAKTLRLASWAGAPPEPHLTPQEYARRLRERLEGVDGVEVIARAYQRVRYSGRAPGREDETSAEHAWRAVRLRLLRRAVLRF